MFYLCLRIIFKNFFPFFGFFLNFLYILVDIRVDLTLRGEREMRTHDRNKDGDGGKSKWGQGAEGMSLPYRYPLPSLLDNKKAY